MIVLSSQAVTGYAKSMNEGQFALGIAAIVVPQLVLGIVSLVRQANRATETSGEVKAVKDDVSKLETTMKETKVELKADNKEVRDKVDQLALEFRELKGMIRVGVHPAKESGN
jgi:ABC-type transporter MlaC component